MAEEVNTENAETEQVQLSLQDIATMVQIIDIYYVRLALMKYAGQK